MNLLKLFLLFFLIFSGCTQSIPLQSITPTAGSTVSQIKSGTFQIRAWQNPETEHKTYIQKTALEEAEQACKKNGFPGSFKVAKTEYSSIKSITLTIQCTKGKTECLH